MLTPAHPEATGVTHARLAHWLDCYGAAWEARDGQAAAKLFTDRAIYHWGPFDVLHGAAEVRRRWAAATGGQREIRFEHAPLASVEGLAFAHWRCCLTRLSTGLRCELDGVFVLRFDADGRCSELREWWLGREIVTAQAPRAATPRRSG